MTNIQLFFAAASLILATVGSLLAWMRWRSDQLRLEDVFIWVNECIECLQSLLIISYLENEFNPPQNLDIDKIRLDIIFKTSILIERGRIFFKNEISDDFGSQKMPAYRGYRPRILDHLVVAHQIARDWPNTSRSEAMKRSALADDCVKGFVSLAQEEVGRNRVASASAQKGGDGVQLAILMAAARPRNLF